MKVHIKISNSQVSLHENDVTRCQMKVYFIGNESFSHIFSLQSKCCLREIVCPLFFFTRLFDLYFYVSFHFQTFSVDIGRTMTSLNLRKRRLIRVSSLISLHSGNSISEFNESNGGMNDTIINI